MYGYCAEHFSLYTLRNLHSSEECLGTCNRHVFLHGSAYHSDVLHRFSCACQRGPYWGWMVRRMIPPFSSLHNWNILILTVEYFWKVLLLRRLPPRFPCARTYGMYPCRALLQIPPLYVGLFPPQVGDGVRDNLVKLFRVHFIGGN